MLDAFAPPAGAALRLLPSLVLLWLAWFFGRTLRAGEMPLIERVARVAKPDLSPRLVRYTRILTTLWCAYFVLAATLALVAHLGFLQASTGVATLSALLFVGEYGLRRLFFPGEYFPNLIDQVRDTVSVWRPQRHD
ncbi:MAG: hypothetical protein K8R60_15170 [Burkholderiales bacterium]|nr:hypothetical protein [Burkholderiales bacterium]